MYICWRQVKTEKSNTKDKPKSKLFSLSTCLPSQRYNEGRPGWCGREQH